jgi:hypothetical protein
MELLKLKSSYMKKLIGLLIILLCLYLLDKKVQNDAQTIKDVPAYDQYEEDAINKQRDLDTLQILNH